MGTETIPTSPPEPAPPTSPPEPAAPPAEPRLTLIALQRELWAKYENLAGRLLILEGQVGALHNLPGELIMAVSQGLEGLIGKIVADKVQEALAAAPPASAAPLPEPEARPNQIMARPPASALNNVREAQPPTSASRPAPPSSAVRPPATSARPTPPPTARAPSPAPRAPEVVPSAQSYEVKNGRATATFAAPPGAVRTTPPAFDHPIAPEPQALDPKQVVANLMAAITSAEVALPQLPGPIAGLIGSQLAEWKAQILGAQQAAKAMGLL